MVVAMCSRNLNIFRSEQFLNIFEPATQNKYNLPNVIFSHDTVSNTDQNRFLSMSLGFFEFADSEKNILSYYFHIF